MNDPQIIVNLNLTVDTVPKLLEAIKALGDRDVLVGIPAKENARPDEPIGNASLAYIHNYGTAGIPARPFAEPGILSQKVEITKRLEGAAKAALAGNLSGVDTMLESAGILGANGMKAAITNGQFKPLAPSTLRARRKRGRMGTRPLIDTGRLRQAITYVVRNKY